MADYMNQRGYSGNNSGGRGFSLLNIGIIVVAGFALYYMYKYLYSDAKNEQVMLVKGQRTAGEKVTDLPPAYPKPFEGGDYTFTTWIYVNSFNKGYNKRKHLFELKGAGFSSLLVGLGAQKNNLIVRTHTKGAEGFEGSMHNNLKVEARVAEGFATTTDPAVGNLSTANVDALFGTLAADSDASAVCDLPDIDMQRWVMVTVVLSGKTIDVYLDGKLTRSCAASSYYRVDATGEGVKPVVLDRGGFDGYVSNMAVSNYALNPDEIYRAYLAGPEGGTYNIISWFMSLFGSKA
jgi:hypothetical protein